MSGPARRLCLVSERAFYPIHHAAFAALCETWGLDGSIVSVTGAEIPDVHRQLGTVDPVAVDADVRVMPAGLGRRARARWLGRTFADLRPDAVWIQEEPTSVLALEALAALALRRRPVVVGAVCENLFGSTPARVRLAGRVLWRRLDGLAATATPSLEGIRAIGLPRSVRAEVLVAGALPPPTVASPLALGLTGAGFVVGFAGRVVEEKGWRTLVDAVASLPPEFAVALAGSGDEEALLREALATRLPGRGAHVGLLPRDELFRFYAAVDCLVLPSRTRPHWTEQFGGVLADAMAVGLPVVGSSSGSIPEVVGAAGLVVPEGDAGALAAALERLAGDEGLRDELAAAGRRRFAEEFAIDAYARKLARLLGLAARPDA